MSTTIHQRKVTASFKLPPDLEKHIKEDIDAGKYSSRSDAYVSVMRAYYRMCSEDKLLQRINALEQDVKELKAELKKNE